MATSYLKSCCDNSITYTLTGLGSALSLGSVYHVAIPNYFSGCSTVIPSSQLLPGSPTYSQSGAFLTGPYANCGLCTSAYPCTRITATSECDVVTIAPMSVQCSPNIGAGTITMLVSGGTPPYKIKWSTGLIGPTISNAVPGVSYGVTVTDYDWSNGGPDYTAVTNCFLALPTSTPAPTPSPTPTSAGLNTTYLCLQVNIGRDNYSYNFTPSNTRINGKFTWTYGAYVLSWQTSQGTSFWRVQMPIGNGANSVILQNTSNTSTPIGTFTVYGVAGATATMLNGVCGNAVMTLGNATVSAPTCQLNPSTGSIYVNTLNAQPPVNYSINGGITNQTNPLFQNLNAGTYNVRVQDGDGTILTQTVVIPQPPATTTYTLDVDTSIVPQGTGNALLNFTVKVKDVNGNDVSTLPPGTTISFAIQEINLFQTTVQGGGNVVSNVDIKKNNVQQTISPVTTTTNSTTPVNATCPAQPTQYNTGTTRQYNGITISGSDSITGTVQVQVNKTAVGNVCILKSNDTIVLVNKQITGCSCCNVSTASSTSLTMQTNAVK